jgi:hypothetical protein
MNTNKLVPILKVWLDKAHELRRKVHVAEVELMLHLVEGEMSGAIPWRGAFDSFKQLLKETGLADPGRYESFRDALVTIGEAATSTGKAGPEAATKPVVPAEKARVIGVDATVIAARLPADKVATGVAAMEAWTRSHGHQPTRDTAKEELGHLAPVTRLPRDLARELKEEDLRKENAALRRELAAAKKRIGELEAELAKKRGRSRGTAQPTA